MSDVEGAATAEGGAGMEKTLLGLQEFPAAGESQAALTVGPEAVSAQPLSAVVHDLRVQIGVVLGYSQLILDEADSTLNPEHREFVSLILAAGRAMHGLVEDHLAALVREQRRAGRSLAVGSSAETPSDRAGADVTEPPPGGTASREEPQP